MNVSVDINGYSLIIDGTVEDDMEATAISNMDSWKGMTVADFISSSHTGWIPCNEMAMVGKPVGNYPRMLFRRKIKQ